jgi:hypothetical protein
MRTLLSLLGLALVLARPLAADVLWSQPRDFYVDPPQGWTFVEDPTPEHFVMTDAGRRMILEIFSQDKGKVTDLAAKALDLRTRLNAQGDEQAFTWNDRPAWLADLTFTAGPVQARGWALVADDGNGWVSALAYAPVTDYDKASDVLNSTLNSLALGLDGRHQPGPLSTFFEQTASKPRSETKAFSDLPSPLSVTYSLDRDEAIQATIERETRLLIAQVGTQVQDQNAIAPGWSRFYRQIYRDLYSSLTPIADYWRAQVDQKKVTPEALPQTVLTWLQKFEYFQKTGLVSVTTPWQTLRDQKGNCDSRSLIYLAIMDQLGVPGILMVSAPYSHAMAALDLPGPGARFPFGNKKWLVAELTTTVALGQIAQDKADPNQWIGVDLWQKP